MKSRPGFEAAPYSGPIALPSGLGRGVDIRPLHPLLPVTFRCRSFLWKVAQSTDMRAGIQAATLVRWNDSRAA